ncbi:hypothetical protein BpHYR1_001430 [Brachionus plicatilis]|uniref:Uncharacterized protein n=1 Tax=Brachionus plicatilis TaxID=10195 RepID=A0A3M7PUH3_BRAPC|nr:hypothetical protein BpHYR1_001430 [Brachionus plicatilis]
MNILIVLVIVIKNYRQIEVHYQIKLYKLFSEILEESIKVKVNQKNKLAFPISQALSEKKMMIFTRVIRRSKFSQTEMSVNSFSVIEAFTYYHIIISHLIIFRKSKTHPYIIIGKSNCSCSSYFQNIKN